MTELSFLLDLLLNQKLNKEVKTLITERIKLIEAKPTAYQPQRGPAQVFVPPELVGQSPSTIANLMKDPIPLVEPAPVIASTAATAMALAERQKAIQVSMSGKPEPGRTSPRKF
jgi:hypothetical protein